MEMAEPPHSHHGNFPQRQAILSPRGTKCKVRLSLEAESCQTGPNPAATAEERISPTEHLSCTRFCQTDRKRSSGGHPDPSEEALLKRIRIHPEAQRILGNSCIAVVSLERLSFQSVLSLQPVVNLLRLPGHTGADETSCCDHPQQINNPDEADVVEIQEETPPESPELLQPQTAATSWTEPYCPDGSLSGEPEEDSGFGCESAPDQPYILFDSGSDEWDPDGRTDSATFYLDPDRDLVIELDPELESDPAPSPQLKDEPAFRCGDQREQSLSPTQEVSDSAAQEVQTGAASEEMDSEDFCAVCLNGGDLLCCDRCPKVYHLACHIPPLISSPLGDWVCTLCRTDHEPAEAYDCENLPPCGGVKAPYTLSNQHQRRCEKLTLLLYCDLLSAPFHEPVSHLARNYYQIIKRPIDLSVIRRKLDKSNTLHYFTAEQFIDDVLLMFKNCATFNYPDSEVAQAGQHLELLFLNRLKDVFPDQTFPSASRDRTDGARLQWLSRKRRENNRRKRYVFTGKKYYM